MDNFANLKREAKQILDYAEDEFINWEAIYESYLTCSGVKRSLHDSELAYFYQLLKIIEPRVSEPENFFLRLIVQPKLRQREQNHLGQMLGIVEIVSVNLI